MDFATTMYVGIGIALAVALVIAGLYSSWRTGQRWNANLDAVARHFGLSADISRTPQASEVNGYTSDGHDVRIHWTTLQRPGQGNSIYRYYEIRVAPRGRPGSMTIAPANPLAPQHRDYGSKGRKGTGIAEIDGRYVVSDVHKGMKKRLKRPEVLSAFLAFMQDGGRLEMGNLVRGSTTFPKNPQALSDQVQKLLDLAEQLGVPQ